MGPHPEVPVDVQKYIGSCLITQQPGPKRKLCPPPCGSGGGSPPVNMCKCCAQGVDVAGYPVNSIIKNYAWTGMPLFSVVGIRQKSRPKSIKPIDRDGFTLDPMEELLPISRLAIHAQGAPLIISDNDHSFWRSGSPSVSAIVGPPSPYNGDPSPRQLSPLPSDCVSTTSEDSVNSENGLPRIIKPRKRRKKDRRMTVGYHHVGTESSVANNGIVTLKPYQPLCYRFSERGFGLCSAPPSSKGYLCDNVDTFRKTFAAERTFHYPSSSLCSCPYCVPVPTTIITPPDSPVDIRDGSWKSPGCDPESGRDPDTKFLTCSSDDDALIPEDPNIASVQSNHFASSHPPHRPWVHLKERDSSVSSCTFTVMCYNILCDKYATRQMYGYCPNWALDWGYRKKIIMHEIRLYKADILSLQEVETEQFYHYFLPELKREGYDGIFSPKSRAKTMPEGERKHVDGCAIFFKTNKFFLLQEHLIEFNQLAMANAEGCQDMLNRVMTKDNIGLVALLQTRVGAYSAGSDLSKSNQTLLVCTAHIHWDPEYSDVKLIQTMMMMHSLKSLVVETLDKCDNPNVQKENPNSIPLLLCGDFNSLPDSGVIEFLQSGRISTTHCDFKQFVYKDCLKKLGTTTEEEDSVFTHPFNISRAYKDDIMPFTNYSYDFKGIIDYVFYSTLHMSCLGVLGPLDANWLLENHVQGCPHPHIPSDHFPIVVELQLAPTHPTHPSLPNGFTAHR